MRFKPRTDLERIVEAVNTNSFGRVGTSILNKHLKEYELGTVKKSSKRNEEISLNNSFDHRKSKIKNNKKGNEEENDKDNLSQKSLLENSKEKRNRTASLKTRLLSKKNKANSVARNVMSDLHKKTHFKATSVFSVLGNSRNQHLEKKTFNKTNSTPDLLQNNATIYNIDFNPLKLNDKVSEESKEKLKFLKTISSVPFLFLKENDLENERSSYRNKSNLFLNKSTSNFTVGHDSMNESYKKNLAQKEGKIIIDNQLYDKKDIHIVAKKILTKCNYIPDIINKYKNKK